MFLKTLLPLALATLTSAASTQTLAEVLASQNETLSTLNGLLASQPALLATLTGATGITILAPNNAAFNTLLGTTPGKAAAANPSLVASILQYHVLSGVFRSSNFTSTNQFIPTLLTNTTQTNVTGGQVVDSVLSGEKVELFSALKQKSTVVTPDIPFTGGVLHIIDTVMNIPQVPSFSAIDSNLTALAGALASASLLTTVDALKDITIFAPSNAAFQAIGSATSSLNTTDLSSILQYHVITGKVGYSSLLMTGLANESLPTVQGGNVMVEVADEKVFVNSAQVVIKDIIVANGVMHVIDNVLNPSNTTASPIPTATVQAVAYVGATSAATVPFTQGIVPTTTAPSSSQTAAAVKHGERDAASYAAALFGVAVLVAL